MFHSCCCAFVLNLFMQDEIDSTKKIIDKNSGWG